MKIKSFLFSILSMVTAALLAQQTNSAQKLSLDKGWRFFEGDIPFPLVRGHDNSMDNIRTGKASAATGPQFDDISTFYNYDSLASKRSFLLIKLHKLFQGDSHSSKHYKTSCKPWKVRGVFPAIFSRFKAIL